MSFSHVIIGLGNPGENYLNTRHNLGWMILDRVAQRLGSLYESDKYNGVLGEKKDLALFKPMTFMNRSGEAVKGLMKDNGLELANILVVTDDLALDLGNIRLREGGSSGGHNGLKSIMEHLGSNKFPRLRAGIGPRPERFPAKEFVLSRFGKDEVDQLDRVIEIAADAVLVWRSEGIEAAMNRFN